MLEKMKQIIADQVCMKPEDITETSRFKEDLNADSLDLFDLLTTLEEEYEIEIPAEDMEKLKTVGDVIEYLHGIGIDG
ncbi:MAG: acyl carrier protein [Eubacterium sp.]|nr:acyl carrier protein [Eubacterium sp.]